MEVLVTLLVILVGSVAVLGVSAGVSSLERPLVRGSMVMHVLFALALRFMQGNIYGEGDLYIFRESSTPFVEFILMNPWRWFPQVVAVMLRLPNDLGVDLGNSSMSMVALTALLRIFFADSFWAIYVFMAFCSFAGKWALYVTFRDELKLSDPRPLVFGCMLIPSLVFWSSGLVKEAVAIAGLGAIAYGLRAPFRFGRVLMGAVGVVFVGVIKPYLLFPFAVGAAAWIGLRGAKRSFEAKPVYLLVGIAVGYALVMLLGTLFPAFAPDAFAESAAEAQLYGGKAGGGSYYQMGDAKARTLSGQLVYAPLALLTTLARPAIFEVHNFTSLIAALEMTALTYYMLRSIVRGGRGGLRAVFRRPIMILCLVNTMIGGTAIGLATTNFGTLSRYRIPVLPFYAAIAVTLAVEGAAAKRSQLAARSEAGVRRRALGGITRAARRPAREASSG